VADDTRSVQVRHPRPHDVVGDTLRIAGLGSGFEGHVVWRLVGRDGTVLDTGGFQAGGMGIVTEFVTEVDLAGAGVPAGDTTVELQVYGDNPGLPDEGPDPGFDVNTVPLTLGRRLLATYLGVSFHQVQPGDTLWGIADAQFGPSSPEAIFQANRDLLDDPDLIHPGQVLRVPVGA
jgi:hypothetical protein